MADCPHDSRASHHLNLIRGVAALAVLIYHVRYRFFPDYADLATPDLTARLFYALTAFGHDAVVVFFVLSGYLISATVMRDCAAGRWSWQRYAVSRWVRLSVVLVPGLLLTVGLDALGLRLFGDSPIYTGTRQAWRHDFFPVAGRLTAAAFVGNLAFLQTVVVPPFGSNEPLWSLSFEFWYYVLFPCAWLAWAAAGGRGRRLALAAVVLALLPLLGRTIALYFPIWLLGAAVARLPLAPHLLRYPRAAALAAALTFLTVLPLSHTTPVRRLLGESVIAADYVTGFACAVVIYALLHNRAASGRSAYARAADGLAGFSYTLYVVHMPLLVFLRAALVPGEPWQPDPPHILLAVCLSAAAVVYAYVLAGLTEAHTDRVRAAVLAAVRVVASPAWAGRFKPRFPRPWPEEYPRVEEESIATVRNGHPGPI